MRLIVWPEKDLRAWSIWNHRNHCVFNGAPANLARAILHSFSLRRKCIFGFRTGPRVFLTSWPMWRSPTCLGVCVVQVVVCLGKGEIVRFSWVGVDRCVLCGLLPLFLIQKYAPLLHVQEIDTSTMVKSSLTTSKGYGTEEMWEAGGEKRWTNWQELSYILYKKKSTEPPEWINRNLENSWLGVCSFSWFGCEVVGGGLVMWHFPLKEAI